MSGCVGGRVSIVIMVYDSLLSVTMVIESLLIITMINES